MTNPPIGMFKCMMAGAIMLALVMVGGCGESEVPDDRLVQSYADVIVARQSSGDTAVVQKAIDSVLTMRGYASEDFHTDLRSMARTPQLMKSFYDSVTSELTRRRDALRDTTRQLRDSDSAR
jgi:hypothetical protein